MEPSKTKSLIKNNPQDSSNDEGSQCLGSFLPQYLTTPQAAAYLQVSTQWLEIGRVKGYGPKFIKFGRMVRYRKKTIDDYLQAREVENTIQGGANEK